MKFQAAYSYMKSGLPIALPEWGGFWIYDKDSDEILICLRTGEVISFTEAPSVSMTIEFMFRDDWQIVENFRHTEFYKNSSNQSQLSPEDEEQEDLAPLQEPEEEEEDSPNVINIFLL